MKGVVFLLLLVLTIVCGSRGCGVDIRECKCKCECNPDDCEFSQRHNKITTVNKGTLNHDGECICNCNCCNDNANFREVIGECEHCSKIQELVFVRGDCTKFCVCEYLDKQGLNKVKDCPSGLYFDYALQKCEWPLDSDCPYK
ncbi:hypothetical protein ACFFRR_003529 [Megaselia abdita]